MSDVLEIRVKKSHVAVLSVVVLVASASAAVNVRDPMNVFGDLNMQNNVIQNPQDIKFEGGTITKQVDLDGDGDFDSNDAIVLATSLNSEDAVDFNRDGEISFDDAVAMNYAIGTQRSFDPDTGEATFPKYNSLGRFNSLSTALSWYTLNPNINEQGPKNVSIRSDLDLQGNNIYNVGNLNEQAGGGGTGTALDWENAYSVADFVYGDAGPVDSPASVSCEPGEILVSASCTTGFDTFGGELNYMSPEKCDTRTKRKAKVQYGRAPGISGTCVPTTSTSNGETGGGGNGGSTGIGEVDIIEEGGTLGPYKYCSIAKLEYPEDAQGGCTVSRNSEGVWEKTTNTGRGASNNNYECHAACFGLQTETATVTVDASPSGGNIQTVPLDQEYQNIIKAEWTGGDIQPERTPDGAINQKAAWRISLYNSETNQRHEIVSAASMQQPGYTQSAEPPYFAEGRYRGTSLNPVTEYTDSYTARFSQVTADEIKLNAGGYSKYLGPSPQDAETIYWSGFEEVKITYVTQN